MAFEQASDGNGQVIAVVAEPGVGKSRLCHEFAERCRARGVAVFSAHGLSHARAAPFVPVLELLRAQFGIEQDEAENAPAQIAGVVHNLDPSLAGALPLLYDFMGVADPARPAPAIDPEARQRQIFGTLARLRRARSTQHPSS